MTIGDPQMLISRHVSRLVEKSEMEKAQKVLRRVDLVRQGGIVRRADRCPMSFQDCYRCKQAVKEILGLDAYTYAKVNFVLGGCNCADCRASRGKRSRPLAGPSRDDAVRTVLTRPAW